MTRVLIIKNIETEGPGTIEDFLKDRDLAYQIIELHMGQRPDDLESYSHLVVMGGPMGVYEMDKYPYLRDETQVIEEFIKKDKAVLGICLGAQMVAHVLGARVYKGPVEEIGWFMVQITEDGLKDRAMASLEVDNTRQAEVFQWHGDTFDLPEGALRLATSETYPNQAFRYGDRVYALQFHIEVTPSIVREWFEDEKGGEAFQRAVEIFDDYLKRAYEFYKGFFLTNP